MRTTKDRDAILGKALVRTLQYECEMDHPEIEGLAALIDNKLSPDERTRLMGHMASCDRCYELFIMSFEMAKERQGAGRTASFRMPLALAAGLLVIVGAFLAYKGLLIPSVDIVAVKIASQKEAAPHRTAPSELKQPSASPTASVPEEKMKEVKRGEKNRKEKPASVFYARVAVSDALEEFLNEMPDDTVTDRNKIGELVAMLSKDDMRIGKYDIDEVRIELGNTLMRSARRSFEKAEITIRNGVLTIKRVADSPDGQ